MLYPGIRTFRRQKTKEERLKGGAAGDPADGELIDTTPIITNNFAYDEEEIEKLRDDLEATKQIVELEIRSKKLLERDNKRLQAEIEKLKAEYMVSWTPNLRLTGNTSTICSELELFRQLNFHKTNFDLQEYFVSNFKS